MKKLLVAGAVLAFCLSNQAQSLFSESVAVETSPALVLDPETATPTFVTSVTAESVGPGVSVGVGLNAVPEPSTYALIGSGAAGLFFVRRRK